MSVLLLKKNLSSNDTDEEYLTVLYKLRRGADATCQTAWIYLEAIFIHVCILASCNNEPNYKPLKQAMFAKRRWLIMY